LSADETEYVTIDVADEFNCLIELNLC